MNYQKIKFQNRAQSSFFSTLRQRVDAYFTQNQLSKDGGTAIIIKACTMLLMYLVPYGLILWGDFPLWVQWLFTVIMGIGVAGVGMSVMHDANHGSFSSKNWINQLFGASLYLLGGNVFNWKMQHNRLHHTYTNIHEIDEDITGKVLLRLSYQEPRKLIHRFQHVFALFLYSLMSISFLVKDFKEIFLYRKMSKAGLVDPFTPKELAVLFATKIGYFAWIGALPLLFTDLTFGQWLIGFLTMHATTGFILSVVFQLAHVVEGAAQPVPNGDGCVESAWAVHQLQTTANFAGNNPLLSWYVGGLDYQVEHHLFPMISHVHYKAIAPIVEQTAREFGVPYQNNHSLLQALGSHLALLRDMGRYDEDPAKVRVMA